MISTVSMTNGGYCLDRSACWSQSVTEVVVTAPFRSIFPVTLIHNKLIKVEFTVRNVQILYDSAEVFCMPIAGGTIYPDESTWYVSEESASSTTTSLVLVLVKQLLPAEETFPGCEWWSHVFEGDEKIETLTCTIGSDMQSLPGHAVERRDREHARFMALSNEEKEAELEGIRKAKEVKQEIVLHIMLPFFLSGNVVGHVK